MNLLVLLLFAIITASTQSDVVWTTPVYIGEEFVADFQILSGQEPVDAVHRFVQTHDLPVGYRYAILKEACERIECSRIVAVIWEKTIIIDGRDLVLQVFEGENVANKVFSTLHKYSVPYEGRKKVMDLARADGVVMDHEHAHILSEKIISTEKDFVSTLNIYDDGKEPIDVIYSFCKDHDLESRFEEISNSIMPKICDLVKCERDNPVVFTYPIYNALGVLVSKVYILRGEEPVDAIHRFSVAHSLDNVFRMSIIKDVCSKLTCNRTVPIVYAKTINDSSGKFLGKIQVFQGEEVIDAVFRFLRQSNIDVDEVGLKKYILDEACNQKYVTCTRGIAHIFDKKITNPDGEDMGRLTIQENDEPADKVFQFCTDSEVCHNDYISNLIKLVCDSENVQCNRRTPVVLSIPLSGDSDSGMIGNLEVYIDEEPVDAIYRFFVAHNLFEKNWDLRTVISQICNLESVTCNRKRAIKFFSHDFKMAAKNLGSLVIWDDEEVIDVLYELRLRHNLTVFDQMKAFGEICGRIDVYCSRSRAVVYELGDLTKQDFEKFGNETCIRNSMGWKYLTSVGESTLGSKLAKVATNETITHVVVHPLCTTVTVLLLLACMGLFVQKSSLRSKNVVFKMLFYINGFILACLVQIMIEPIDRIDEQVHVHEGKMPNLVILEDQEPVDAVLLWAKEASKDHHPVVRTSIHLDMIEKVCNEIKPNVECTRQRAWEYIEMGALTYNYQKYDIEFYNPRVVESTKTDFVLAQIEATAMRICSRIIPELIGCQEKLNNHITQQLEDYEMKRMDSKNVYVKLGLEYDAPHDVIFPRAASLIRAHKMNVSPYGRVDNGTRVESSKGYHILDNYMKMKDLEKREWYDKPCTPYFGGALCAKTDSDGNMIIEV